MIEDMEFHGMPASAAPVRPVAIISKRHREPGQTLPDSRLNIPMLGTIRVMLGLAVDAAFDLRAGRERSHHLDRFEEMLGEQIGLLDGLEKVDFALDPGLLTHRARRALDGFATAVRQEIVEDVRPGMDSGVFDAALKRMADQAVVAGAAFASLDLSLDRLLLRDGAASTRPQDRSAVLSESKAGSASTVA
jgi:hypothetical protein